MSVDTPAQAGVSIDALLAAKEQRAARQADWLAHYQQPVISCFLREKHRRLLRQHCPNLFSINHRQCELFIR